MNVKKVTDRMLGRKSMTTAPLSAEDARRFEIESKLRKAFSRSSTSGIGALFSTNSIVLLTAFTTFALQFISFLTTMFGAEFYLSGVFFLAPLLFALAIQGTVYFLSNSLRGHVSVAKIVALLLATLCSNYFSYVGIYNVVNSPEKYLRDDYSRISVQLEDGYTKLKTQAKSDIKQDISELVNTIGTVYTVSGEKLTRINAVKAEIDALLLKNNQAAIPTPPSRPAITGDAVIDAKNKAAYATALANYENQVTTGLNTASSTVQQRMTLILAQMGADYTQQNLLEDIVRYTSIVQLTETTLNGAAEILGSSNTNNYQAIISELRQLSANEAGSENMVSVVPLLITCYTSYPQAPEIEQRDYDTNSIVQLYELAYADTDVLLRDFSEVKLEVKGKSNNMDFFELKTTLDTEISKAMTQINRFSSYDASYEQYSTADMEYAMTDIYTYPIQVLGDPALQGNAISCLVMALLIDWLTIVFAVLARKHGGVLDATENDDLTVWNERLTEEIALSSMLVEKGMDSTSTNYLTDSLTHLSDFIKVFSINYSFIDDSGFILWAKRSDLEEYKVLLTYLCQFNYARIVPREYFIEMLKDGSGQHQDVSWVNAKDHDEYVLLKTKFVLWFVQKFSVLASMEELKEAFENPAGNPESDTLSDLPSGIQPEKTDRKLSDAAGNPAAE